jgi:uncharacterized phage protein (TIGR02218 family)
MRTLDAGLRTHLDGTCTTLCFCWKLIRADDIVLGFTDHDAKISFNGTDFEALAGFEASAAEALLGLNVDTQDVAGVFSSNLLDEDDLAAGRYDNARVETWLVNWEKVEEREFLRVGFLGEISHEDGRFIAEFRSLTNQLDQTKGRRFMPLCDAVLGDANCGVVLQVPGFLANGAVDTVQNRLLVKTGDLDGFADNWFARGRINWTSGANTGLAVEVTSSLNEDGVTTIQLWKPMPFTSEIGDTFTITTGCDKCFETCKSKFTNHLNFRGFPHMPGNDFTLSYADQASEHDGSPLVA